jgi:exonuclease SbcC
MIPIKLELENFLPFRQPDPLDFSGIHVACLSGDNGAGKSSLLDAITWALWGKARARRDDELIHLGQDEMQVEFTFDLEGNRYRVLRQRKAGKRGRTVLELQVAPRPVEGDQGDDGLFRSISESTVRQTQAKINDLLRLDYDTFVNSAFLRQGRADEFTVKTPGERKQILADILGLDQWEVYEERAKARIKSADEQMAILVARLEEIDRELAREEEYQADLTAARAETLRLADALRAAEDRLRDVQAARQDLAHKQRQLDDLTRRLSQGERELAAVADELATAQARVEGYGAILAQADEIEAGYERWATAREADAAFNALLAQQTELIQRRADLEAALAEARSGLVVRQSALNQQVIELKRRAAGARVTADLEGVQAELTTLSAREVERDALQGQLALWGEEAGERRANITAFEAKGTELNERLQQLSDVDEPRCPLCGQELSEKDRADLVDQLQAEREAMRADWHAHQVRVKAIAEETAEQRRRLDQLVGELKRLPALQRRAAELGQRVADAREAMAQLDNVQADLSLVGVQLDNDDYALEARRELRAAQAQLDQLGYDAEAHRTAQATLTETTPFEARHGELSRAQEEIAGARETVEQLRERKTRWEKQLAEDRSSQAALQNEITQLNAQLADADQVEAEVEGLRREESAARMRLGAAQQRLGACQALKKQREERQAEQTQLAEERAIYDELRVAFGKKGVPAMIIEAAIPEIEETANALLTRMTAGRMHVRFETQREKVTGGVAETLDIQISDELGTRNYELYSGGESFRINFAIRIALSQLLARRAGARLRTLVIDEGFGTQDAQGRERLVEAINAIQSDFDRVLVITHIDELKDAFPARIQVTKTPAGSQLEVV